MPSIMQIAVASTLLALSAAVPTVQKRSAFTIRQTANPHYDKSAASKAKVLALKAAAALTTSGSVNAIPRDYDIEYYSPITIDDEIYGVHFDTGSADLWVFGSDSRTDGRPTYFPGSTGRRLNGRWSIHYADRSSAEGIVYADSVDIAGVKVDEQAFGVATYVSSEHTSDGILGLAFSDINSIEPRQRTWFDSAVDQGMPPLFAADLVANAPGFYDFGELSDSYWDSDITYTSVDSSEGYWQFTPESLKIGSGSPFRTGPAIIDTGTSLILLDDSMATAYYSQVRGARYIRELSSFAFLCSTTLPDLTVTVHGHDIVIPGSYLNHMPIYDDRPVCYGGVQRNIGHNTLVFGAIFVKSQYVIFDQKTRYPRLGFADKVDRSDQ